MERIKILREVMNQMEPEMANIGFTKVFSRQMFSRDKDQNFIVTCDLFVYGRYNMAENKSGINIEPGIFVHCKPIEKIYSRISTRELDNVLKYITIGNKLSVFVNNPSGKCEVRHKDLDLFIYEEDDVVKIAKVLVDYFKGIGLPYFERYATWEGLDEIFNSNLSYDSVHCAIEPERSLRGIIVAKLIGRKDLDELVKIQSERIRSKGVERFEVELNRLLEILDSIAPLKGNVSI